MHDNEPYHRQGPLADIDHQVSSSSDGLLAMCEEIRDLATHHQLQDDLVDHLWMLV
jgi:hypothetical protein